MESKRVTVRLELLDFVIICIVILLDNYIYVLLF